MKHSVPSPSCSYLGVHTLDAIWKIKWQWKNHQITRTSYQILSRYINTFNKLKLLITSR